MTTNLINNINSNDFTVYKTASGTTVTETISQTNNSANAIARQIISVAGTTADDPSLKFNIGNTSGYVIGSDNSASDILKIGYGVDVTPSSGTAMMTLTTAGIIQQPTQSCFLAYLSADTGSVTGDGTAYTVICDTEVYDLNADYATNTGKFTAPVTAKYSFYTFSLAYQAAQASQDSGNTFLKTSNLNYSGQWYNTINGAYNTALTFVGHYLVDMDAADTAEYQVTVGTGAKGVKIGGGSPAGFVQSYFSGNLEC